MSTTYTSKARRALNKLRLEQAQMRLEKAKIKIQTASTVSAQYNAEREYWVAVRDVADYRRRLKRRKKKKTAGATVARYAQIPMKL